MAVSRPPASSTTARLTQNVSDLGLSERGEREKGRETGDNRSPGTDPDPPASQPASEASHRKPAPTNTGGRPTPDRKPLRHKGFTLLRAPDHA